MGPLPSIPRPSTALGTRTELYTSQQLLESSESEDTERGGMYSARPRSAMQGGEAGEDYDGEFLRYGGTVGVRNPRLVAQMRGIPPGLQQQHIQMNMMGGRWS